MKKYKESKKFTWKDKAIEAFHYCRVAVSNFIRTLKLPSYRLMHRLCYWWLPVHDSESLVGSQLNWSASEKVCYSIYYGVKLFKDLLDNRYFILKTDHMNLTYINVTFTGKVLRWKMCLQVKDFALFHVAGKEEHQFVPSHTSSTYFGRQVDRCPSPCHEPTPRCLR
jgi:hypothetical protein